MKTLSGSEQFRLNIGGGCKAPAGTGAMLIFNRACFNALLNRKLVSFGCFFLLFLLAH